MTNYQEIFHLFSKLETDEEAEKFLKDILTEKELEEIRSRWILVKSLSEGKSQRKVRDEAGVSIATVTRGAKILKSGKGGIKRMLEKVSEEKDRHFKDLEQIRGNIDDIDRKIISLLGERLKLMPYIAQFKRHNDLKLEQKDRELISILKKKKYAKDLGIDPHFIDVLFTNIFSESKKLQLQNLLSHSLTDVKKIAKESPGKTLPIFLKIKTDSETPISLYQRITKNRPYSFILESIGDDNNFARYSFIGTNPKKILRFKDRVFDLLDLENSKNYVREFDDPLAVLRQEMQTREIIKIPELPRFVGGAVGFLGYDAIRYFEKSVSLPPKDDLNLPESMYALYDEIVSFDHQEKMITFTILLDLDGEIEAKYEKVLERFSNLLSTLEESIKISQISTNIVKEDIDFKSNYERKEFIDLVEEVKKEIIDGEVFQIVLSQRFETKIDVSNFDLYRSLRQVNPSSYLFFLNYPDFSVIGASPETLVQVEDGKVRLRALAGTRKRGKDKAEDKKLELELINDEKEQAEHLMLVDLARNDVGKISKIGTVEVNDLMKVVRSSFVMHLATDVTGELANNLDALEVLKSCFPRGTLSGAPKVRAMELIGEYEKCKRGLYGGAVHYLDYSGNLDAAICIRTMIHKGDTVYVQAGCGVVYDSVPEKEYEETLNKARGVLRSINQAQQYNL